MKITIKRIAELSGVSRGTVDRVIHDRGSVKQEVKEKILKVLKEYNYKPNLVAKALAEKQYSKKKIFVILNSVDNPFYIPVIDGIKEKYRTLEDFGIELIFKNKKGYDINEQLEAIEEALRQNASGLIITPINDERISNKLNDLYNLGIPVVNLNIDVENSKKLAFVGSDYFKSGVVAASILKMIVGVSDFKVLVVTGSKKILGHNLRVNGFSKFLINRAKNIEILGVIENQDDDKISYDLMKRYLMNNKDIDGVYFSAAGIKGGLQAINEFLQKKIKIITVDLTEEVRKGIENNTILATICQEPYRQGQLSLEIIFDYIISKKIPEDSMVITKNEIIIKENL